MSVYYDECLGKRRLFEGIGAWHLSTLGICNLLGWNRELIWKNRIARSRIMMSMNNGIYIGADGCRGGWIVSLLVYAESTDASACGTIYLRYRIIAVNYR